MIKIKDFLTEIDRILYSIRQEFNFRVISVFPSFVLRRILLNIQNDLCRYV